MKKLVSLILCAACLFAACACTVSAPDPSGADTPSGKTSEYVFDLGVTADNRFFETDDSIYCLSSSTGMNNALDIIYFSDKENKLWMPLCSRPNCSHRDENCSARFESTLVNGIWIYGQYIYYLLDVDHISDVELWRMGLDGSDHTKVLALDLAPEGKEYAIEGYSAFFHNKYVVLDYTGETGETLERFHWIVDLSAEQPEMKELVLKFENGEVWDKYLSAFTGRGSMILFANPDYELYKADLEAGTIEKLCDLPYFVDIANMFYLNGDTLTVADGYDNGFIVSVDINSGELKEVNSAEPKTNLWSRPYKDYIFGSMGSHNPEMWGTYIYDGSGELIKHIPHEEYEDKELRILHAVGDYVFGSPIKNRVVQRSEVPLWYIDIREIGTDALAWHKWEKADFRPGSAQG